VHPCVRLTRLADRFEFAIVQQLYHVHQRHFVNTVRLDIRFV
jgi:hypothetical protein